MSAADISLLRLLRFIREVDPQGVARLLDCAPLCRADNPLPVEAELSAAEQAPAKWCAKG